MALNTFFDSSAFLSQVGIPIVKVLCEPSQDQLLSNW